jgi:SAM-dependent methyltransferase
MDQDNGHDGNRDLANFLKTFERRVVKPRLRRLKPWRRTTYGMPRQARVFEWCAGPGFIGFALLGYGFCDTLCLADVNPEAVEACRRTIAQNRLAERVAVYHSDNLEGIPASEQWDLVVGNPPHFVDVSPGELRFHDQDWKLHRRFFATIGRFLKPGGVIVLLENNRGSTAETFRNMLEAAGLSIVFVHNCEGRRTPYTRTYYLGIARRGDTVPAWARLPVPRSAPIETRRSETSAARPV